MATGRSTKLAGQAGEYLVAAELSRRGLIATTFTGNVPHYDIIASDEKGRHVSVQVKTSRGGSWQFGNMSIFCDISFQGKRQIVGSVKKCPV
jgi:Holliday junction resolvase-like predicted endonuclease